MVTFPVAYPVSKLLDVLLGAVRIWNCGLPCLAIPLSLCIGLLLRRVSAVHAVSADRTTRASGAQEVGQYYDRKQLVHLLLVTEKHHDLERDEVRPLRRARMTSPSGTS